MSIHPTTTNDEINYVCDSIIELAKNHKAWSLDYEYSKRNNEFIHKSITTGESSSNEAVDSWFSLD